MTYSKMQVRKRYLKGLFVGILIGAALMFVGTSLIGLADDLDQRFGDWFTTETDGAAEQAEALRERAAELEDAGGGDLHPEDIAALQEQALAVREEQSETEGGDVPSEDESISEESVDVSSEEDGLNVSPSEVYVDTSAAYSVAIPTGWTYEKVGGEVRLEPEHADGEDEAGHVHDPQGFLLRTRSKEQDATLRETYDGTRAPAYFLDAASGATEHELNGHSAVTFRGVVGYTPTTITAVDLGNRVVEIHDPGERHQSNGNFSYVLGSFAAL